MFCVFVFLVFVFLCLWIAPLLVKVGRVPRRHPDHQVLPDPQGVRHECLVLAVVGERVGRGDRLVERVVPQGGGVGDSDRLRCADHVSLRHARLGSRCAHHECEDREADLTVLEREVHHVARVEEEVRRRRGDHGMKGRKISGGHFAVDRMVFRRVLLFASKSFQKLLQIFQFFSESLHPLSKTCLKFSIHSHLPPHLAFCRVALAHPKYFIYTV